VLVYHAKNLSQDSQFPTTYISSSGLLVERGKKAGDYYYYYLKQMKKPNAKKDTNRGIFICEEKNGIRKLSLYRELQRPRVTPTHDVIGLCAWYIQINAPPNILPPSSAEIQMKRNTFSCFLYGGGEGRGVGLAPRGFSHVKGLGCKFS
jgi:hypothetical protein